MRRAPIAAVFSLALALGGCSSVSPTPLVFVATPVPTSPSAPAATAPPAQPTPTVVAVTPAPTVRPTPVVTPKPSPFVDPLLGAVVFGTHLNATSHQVDRPNRFGTQGFAKRITSICWSAQFAVAAGSDSVTQLFARVIAGGGARPLQSKVVIADPSHRVYGGCADLAALAGLRTGTYRLSFLDGDTVLATGTFVLH
jgi:hypothetical protein